MRKSLKDPDARFGCIVGIEGVCATYVGTSVRDCARLEQSRCEGAWFAMVLVRVCSECEAVDWARGRTPRVALVA